MSPRILSWSFVLILLAAGSSWAADPRHDPTSSLIAARERVVASYHAKSVGPSTFEFSNAAQGLIATIDASGYRVGPKTAAVSAAPWGLRLARFGREGMITPVRSATLSALGQRVELARAGITEWYVNDARGIEQGFTISDRPATMSTQRLAIELEVTGALSGSESQDAIEFANEDRSFVIHYAHLRTIDALGNELPSSMTLEGSLLRILVDDANATYPIVVDPLTFNPSWGSHGGVGSFSFGESVSSAGDVNADGFSDVIVGAPLSSNGQGWEGFAYVFHGSPSGLSPLPNWKAESNVQQAGFGQNVSGVGDVNNDGFDDVAVVTEGYQVNSSWEGECYVYLGSATGLSTTPASIIQIGSIGWGNCYTVAGVGDVTNDGFDDVLVGHWSYLGVGIVYVHAGTATGVTLSPVMTLASPPMSSGFGYGMDGAGDVNNDGYADAIIGANAYSNGEASEGAAFVFHGSNSGLNPVAAWSAESDVTGANFGWSVGGAGDLNGDGFDDVVVGAPLYSTGTLIDGRGYAFLGSAAGLASTPNWSVRSDRLGSSFGSAVAGAGDVDGDGFDDLLIGAPSFDDLPASSSRGRMFVYRGAPTGPESVAAWASAANGFAFMGMSVAGAGDVNGDGFADVVGGGQNSDNGAQGAQAYHGGPFGSSAPYGKSKAVNVSTYAPRLMTAAAPKIGTTTTLNFVGGASLGTNVFLILGFQPTALPFDAGTLNVVPFSILNLPNLNGAGGFSLSVPIPALPSLQDVDVYFQAGHVNPAAPGPAHTVLTNGIHWVLGT